jgi:hypothetical protein
MTVTTLISVLPYALLICGWICFLIFQFAPEKEKKQDFDCQKFWFISTIACFLLSLVFLLIL